MKRIDYYINKINYKLTKNKYCDLDIFDDKIDILKNVLLDCNLSINLDCNLSINWIDDLIFHRMKRNEIPEGTELCPKCKGWRYIIKKEIYNENMYDFLIVYCEVCDKDNILRGYIDWTERIIKGSK